MKPVLTLGAVGVVLVAVCSPAQARLVASDEESGRIPTVGVGVTIGHPKTSPRIEVRAQPPDRVRIKQDLECLGRTHSRSKGRQIRTKPPFSGRLALTLKNPVVCTFVVVVQYVEASEPDGGLKTGMIKLRLYR
jgi:hypothetical protein